MFCTHNPIFLSSGDALLIVTECFSFQFSLIVWKSNKTSHALPMPFMEGYTIFFYFQQ